MIQVAKLASPWGRQECQPHTGGQECLRQVELFDTIDRVPLDQWDEARSSSPSTFTDADFIRAVEAGLPQGARVFHAVIYDDDGRPAACTSLCLLPVNLFLLAGPTLRKFTAWPRRLGLGNLKLLICGLPVSAGQSQLAFADGADRPRALAKLDPIVRALARRERVAALVYKEFVEEDRSWADQLLGRGYFRADSPPMYEIARPFADFEAYTAALKSHYRNDVRRSLKKFESAGCTTVHLTDANEIERVYTPEVHALYEAVVAKSDVKLELLPIGFFHQLANYLPGRVSLTAIYRDNRIVAFNWGFDAGQAYHFLFCGIDYSQNADCDLYFNVMYQQFDRAFRAGAKSIELGQTADAFKARLGCTGSPRYFYAKIRNPLLSWCVRRGVNLLFPQRPIAAAHDVFKSIPATKVETRKAG